MSIEKRISVIGGDFRINKLALMLADDGHKVRTFAMEKSNEIMEDERIIKCENLDEAINKSDIIIGSVPFLREDKEMYVTFSDEHIKFEDLVKEEHKDKIFIAGSIQEEAKKMLLEKYGNVIDIMQREEFAVLNTIATAEGAINVAITNTDKILHGSKVLVLGFGRVGKVIARKFSALSADVTCAARKDADLAWINAFGYHVTDINKLGENLSEFDIIINTVPQMIINHDRLQYMKKDVLLIDLASNPGGINRDDAKKLELKLVWALALPGKVAPLTSAGFMKQTIYNIFRELT